MKNVVIGDVICRVPDDETSQRVSFFMPKKVNGEKTKGMTIDEYREAAREAV